MPRRRLSLGETLAAAGGVVLLLTTLIPWFGQKSSGGIVGGEVPKIDRTLNAWSALPVLAILVVLVAAVPIWQAVRRLRDDVPPYPQFLLAAGALGVALVLGGGAIKFGDEGAPGVGAVLISTNAKAGFVVALVASLLIAGGGVLAMWRPQAGPRTPRPQPPTRRRRRPRQG